MEAALAALALMKAAADYGDALTVLIKAAEDIIALADDVPAEVLDQIDAERKRLLAQAQSLNPAPT